ncbi:glycosyl transferase [Leptospirillum ferriphilum]|jgi:glycosyltransferase involved in cell wall biosynthesis|uniref:Glycosyl transferase n=2 Tax=Leptospirillum TaxID=179 RepID=A0A094WFA8_9BACT|nr:glycosyltransferase family 2 protein [Leptospirillum ferriphilum]EDZ38465.1 MAG: Putative glycosyl transferase, family 2 [Leptospirillum sp. Group II '5-way CG']KGA94327.1 glycosyl transferase [Leptospirillum ferriphilum]
MKPIISVILPFYREGSLLAPSIDSVLSQTFVEWELVLIDNNASEETRHIARDYANSCPEKIRIIHEPEQGVISARNTGVLQARGEFIAFTDGDDLMKPERLKRQYEILSSRPELSIVACHYDLLSHDGQTVLEKNCPGFTYGSKNILEWKSYLKALFHPFHLQHIESFDLFGSPFLFFRKEVALKAGLMDKRFNPRDLEDFEFCMRMFELGGFDLIPEALQFYRTENAETRKNKHKDKHTKMTLDKLQTFLTVLWERYGRDYPDNHPVFQSLLAFHLNNFGCYLMRFSHGKKIGSFWIRRAVFLKPEDLRYWKSYIKTFLPKRTHHRYFDFPEERQEELEFDRIYANRFCNLKFYPPEPKGKIE